MHGLPEELFANPVWHALRTRHRHFALAAGDALRYPADVAPFVAVGSPTGVCMMQLHTLLEPGESVWLIGCYPDVPGLAVQGNLECLQMALPGGHAPNHPAREVVRLSKADAAEMVALTAIAFPGFFRKRTCEMGSYYGVRSSGELIAMGGERLMLDGYAEISGVCTHPAHRGQGFAQSIISQIVGDHRRAGLRSWLHAGSENRRAIDLYLRMGFEVSRTVTLTRISRMSA
ncbi:MAG TPA: GNAT family N-acetyltransferase [Bryobacteraceae bacterium]|nr:GNAT family N-acetyltransferase [Bryobacteraceae bacterium]